LGFVAHEREGVFKVCCARQGIFIVSLTLEREATVASFTDMRLRPETLRALAGMDISTPTPIQTRTLPALLEGRDIIGQARTGSGKTLAFGIPAVEAADPRQRAVQTLILTPTRELAVQIGGVLDAIGRERGVTTTLIFGGRTPGPQIAALRRGAPIVVGTPGRVLDLMNQGALDLRGLRFLVLDEADEMLDRGFAPDVERILSKTPRDRQTALFSATVPAWVGETAHKHLRNPIQVKVDPRPDEDTSIEHVAWEIADGDKLSALYDLLDRRGQGAAIVFGRTKHGVKKLARQMEQAGYPVGALQGNLSQNARDKVMEDFRAGRIDILVATNVAARGLDITSVDLVINMDLPESPELLTHRVGRTGRMGRAGQALTLLAPEDAAKWRQLERGLSKRISRRRWTGAADALGDAAAPVSRPATPVVRSVAPAPAPVAATERGNRRPAQPRRSAPVGQPAGNRQPSQPMIRDFQPSPEKIAEYFGKSTAPQNAAGAARPSHRPAAAPIERVSDRRQGRSPQRQRVNATHDIVCSGCGKPSQVPFQPDPTRPVYCSDCFQPRQRTATSAGRSGSGNTHARRAAR
jgi:ATP-dependent RNA helicase DeaD